MQMQRWETTQMPEFLTAFMWKHGRDGMTCNGGRVSRLTAFFFEFFWFFWASHCLPITPTGQPCMLFSKVCCLSKIKAKQNVHLKSFHSSAINEVEWMNSRSRQSRTPIAVCVLAGFGFNPPSNRQLGQLVLNPGGDLCQSGLKLRAKSISALTAKSNSTENS